MPSTLTVDVEKAKQMAKALAMRLSVMGVPIGHSQALEAVSAVLGYPEWNVACAKLRADGSSAGQPKSPEEEVREFARSKGVAVLGTFHIPSEYARFSNVPGIFPNPATFAKAVEEYATSAFSVDMAREMLWNRIDDVIASKGERESNWYADYLNDRAAAPKP